LKVSTAFIATCGIASILSIIGVFVKDRGTESRWKISDPWRHCIEGLVLSFSDQQLVTGLSILLVGYVNLPISQGQISVLDFVNTVNLAWFSALTHIVNMIVLREYFRKFPVLWIVRLTLMLAFGLFLFGSLAVVLLRNGFSALNCPAKCVFQSTPPADFNLSFAIGATPITSELSTNQSGVLNIGSLIALIAGYFLAIYPMFLDGGLPLPMDLFAVFANLLNCAFALWAFFKYRAWAQQLIGNQEENMWSFGQIIPLLLFLIPVLQALEIFYGSR
jgi:hypothetical protein